MDRWDEWKATKKAAAKVPDLEVRVKDLEERLGGKWPADVCNACGERALRMTNSSLGRQVWTCEACGEAEFRPVKQSIARR